MKTIQIVGSGCAQCTRLYEMAKMAAQELKIDYTLEKITDITRIVDMGVMITPAIVVDDIVKVAGRIPSPEELKAFLE